MTQDTPVKKIASFLHYYLGCECHVKCKEVGNGWLQGKIVEVTNGSNHGNWIEVLFPHMVKVHRNQYNNGYSQSNMHHFFMSEDEIKPILRPLSDMTEEEAVECAGLSVWEGDFVNVITERTGFKDIVVRWGNHSDADDYEKQNVTGCLFYSAEQFHYLLSKGFDLFGLIEAGLAIDKTSLITPEEVNKRINNV